MDYFYLSASVFLIATSSIFGSCYNLKNEQRRDPTPIFNLLLISAALVGWSLFYAFDFSFNLATLPYAIIFAVGHALVDVGFILALATGPVSLTSLILQLSLIGTTVWGFIFWGEEPTLLTWLGLVLVVIAIALCLFSPKKNGADKKPITLKWILFATMAFVGNATCTIAQRTHQTAFDGKHGNMLMAFAMLFLFLFFLILYRFSNRADSRKIIKDSWYFPVASGSCNLLLNLFVIMLAVSELPPSLIYPVISVGGIMITSLFSVFFLKERLYAWQWCGIGVGTAAIVALSI